MRPLKKLRAKLRARQGESLTEVLVAVLIAALSLVILASMVSSSGKMITASGETMDRYVQAENRLVTQTGASVNGSVTLRDSAGQPVRLTDDDGTAVPVQYYIDDEIGGCQVVSYKVRES